MASARKLVARIQNKTRGKRYRSGGSYKKGTVMGDTFRKITANHVRSLRKKK